MHFKDERKAAEPMDIFHGLPVGEAGQFLSKENGKLVPCVKTAQRSYCKMATGEIVSTVRNPLKHCEPASLTIVAR